MMYSSHSHFLIKKLDRLGIRGPHLDLFDSYLVGRRQYVRIGVLISNKLPITFDVPQGSILSPTLLLAYINDLCNVKRIN